MAIPCQLISALAAQLKPFLVARWGNARTCTLATAAFMLLLALVPTWGAAGRGFVTWMFFYSMATGAIRIFLPGAGAAPRAAMATALVAGSGLTYAAVSYTRGHISAEWGYQVRFLMGVVLVAAGAVYSWGNGRLRRGGAGLKTGTSSGCAISFILRPSALSPSSCEYFVQDLAERRRGGSLYPRYSLQGPGVLGLSVL